MNERIEIADASSSSAYNELILLTGLLTAIYVAIRFAETSTRLHYDSRIARTIAGAVLLYINYVHSPISNLALPQRAIVAAGPHRTGWEALVLGSKLLGAPPRFFATTGFNDIPFVEGFLRTFLSIMVEHDQKNKNEHLSNKNPIELATEILHKNDECRVVIFPQGNFARINEEPPRIYQGIAKLAVQNQMPIYVIRLDGFWCLQNPCIPLSIRNNALYRAFFSFFHFNNIRVNHCATIDCHLQPENADLHSEQHIEEICAQLYAYYRPTVELSDKDLVIIKEQIENKEHYGFWTTRVRKDEAMKQQRAAETPLKLA